MMHVFTDGEGMVVAASEADARAVMRESGLRALCPDGEIQQLSDDYRLTISDWDRGRITKRCAEWAAERGRGLLGPWVVAGDVALDALCARNELRLGLPPSRPRLPLPPHTTESSGGRS
jgi:hypothetical protein